MSKNANKLSRREKRREKKAASSSRAVGREAFDRSAYGTGGAHSKGRSAKQGAYNRAAGGFVPAATASESSFHGNPSNPYSRSDAAGYVKRAKLAKKKARHKKAGLICLLLVAVVLLGGAGVAWAYLAQIQGNLSENVDEDLLSSLTATDNASDPFYMLLIGADKSEARESSGGQIYRTDSMILVRVDPQEKKVAMVSLPRDTRINLPGYGLQKLNAAYAYGGPAGAVKAISDLTGVEISHYAEVDFDGFEAVVDALGGVDVDVPVEIDDDLAGGHVDAGLHTLSGEEALILCRSRHTYDGNGDALRSANQRLVLTAIMKKVMSSDIGTMTNTISTMSEYVTTDLSVTSILGLAQSMVGIDVDNNVYTAQLPTVSEYTDGVWWEVADADVWETMLSRMDQGLSPSEESTVDASGVITANAGDGGTTSSSSSSTTTSLDDVNIAVKNGAGISGCAADAASKLTAVGAVCSTGNADDYNYSKTLVIYNNASDQSTAQLIADTLGVGTVTKNNGTYSFSGDYLVVVGADWS